jgi:hypothetical protein
MFDCREWGLMSWQYAKGCRRINYYTRAESPPPINEVPTLWVYPNGYYNKLYYYSRHAVK